VCSEMPSTAPPRKTKGWIKVYPRLWNSPRWVGASHICLALPIRTHTLPFLLLCVMKTLGRLKIWMHRSADGVRSSPSGRRRSLRSAAVSSLPCPVSSLDDAEPSVLFAVLSTQSNELPATHRLQGPVQK
jgi:hypothetical protein